MEQDSSSIPPRI